MSAPKSRADVAATYQEFGADVNDSITDAVSNLVKPVDVVSLPRPVKLCKAIHFSDCLPSPPVILRKLDMCSLMVCM